MSKLLITYILILSLSIIPQSKEGIFEFEMHDITDLYTGYELQSNASPQHLWFSPIDGSLNAVFATSQEDSGWTDRTCTYFYSTDDGVSWSIVGNVPQPEISGGARSGFPSIIGTSSNQIVITNHSNLNGGDIRFQLFINSAPGMNNFINYDPGISPTGPSLYPKLGISDNSVLIFANGLNNSFNLTSKLFSGFTGGSLNLPGTYSFSTSDNGKIGLAYLDNWGGALLIESTNEGATWSNPLYIYEPLIEITPEDTFMLGTFRGIDLTYIGETPKVVFEVVKRSLTFLAYYPEAPSQIHLWSPEITNGISRIIADNNNVPFYPNQGVTDGFAPLCRPVIGKAMNNNSLLYVAFSASTQNTNSSNDSTRFYSGYFMMSENGGETWTSPQKFTPDLNPPLDFRYISIAPINQSEENSHKIHLVVQGDPTAGSICTLCGVQGKFYHFSTTIILDIEADEVFNGVFSLLQNYPNPFNPTTKINYSINNVETGHASSLQVTLKVFDVLGKEVATLVNEEKQPGVYEIEFNPVSGNRNLASGVYYYQLKAGNFVETKKMIFLQ